MREKHQDVLIIRDGWSIFLLICLTSDVVVTSIVLMKSRSEVSSSFFFRLDHKKMVHLTKHLLLWELNLHKDLRKSSNNNIDRRNKSIPLLHYKIGTVMK
jgi:hypothetical protein